VERLFTDRVWTCARGLFLAFADEKLSGRLARWDPEPAVASATKRLIVPVHQAARDGGYLRICDMGRCLVTIDCVEKLAK
jgi:hypothetical protein